MKTASGALALALTAALLSGCAGRAPSPVASVLPGDSNLTCEQIKNEVAYNESRITSLQGEKAQVSNANVMVGTVGFLLFPPLLFALDLHDAQSTEITALYQRNMRLTSAPCRRERDVAAVPALDG